MIEVADDRMIYFLHRIKICATLAYFCRNLVAMTTPLTPLTLLVMGVIHIARFIFNKGDNDARAKLIGYKAMQKH